MKIIKASFLFLAIFQIFELKAQVWKDSANFKITLDTNHKPSLIKNKVQAIQGNKIVSFNFNESITLKKGTDFSIDFLNSSIASKKFKNLKIYSDTTIFYDGTILEEVVIKSKKAIVSENTQGFDYFPLNDSLLREKSILLGLQRLPFITSNNTLDELSVPKYKQDGKILFLINGKQRKGVENNWALILKVIKGKDVYKVELIEDIPIQFKNQGYAAVINIQMLEANIYGNSFNAVLFYDQRNNLNLSSSVTTLRKRFDISINAGNNNDNKIGSKETEIKNNNITQSILETNSKYIYDFKFANFDAGFRKDTLKDYALNISAQSTDYSTMFIPIFQSNINTIGITDLFNKKSLSTNFSYIFRKKKDLTFSFASAINLSNETRGNNFAYYIPKQADSNSIRTSANEFNWVADYNILDIRNKKYPKELGIIIYLKNIHQDYKNYNINSFNNTIDKIIYNKTDSFITNQYSIRPYLKWINNISKTKRISISLSTDVYIMKNVSTNNVFFVPSLAVGYRKILDSKNSLRYTFNVDLLKPNLDYLSTMQVLNDPQQQRVGNALLRPSKYINTGVEWVRRKEYIFSLGIKFAYNFDQLDFFSKVNPINNTIQNIANNGLNSFRISNTISFQKMLFKKVLFDLNGSINFYKNSNLSFNTSYNRVTFYNETNFRYDLAKKKGSLSFRLFYSANPTNGQGYTQGTRMYGLVYSNVFLKRKLAYTLIADQFLLKNRTRLFYSKTNNFEIITNSVEPYQYLKIRLAYNFSNIKLQKMAAKKATEILGEAQRL